MIVAAREENCLTEMLIVAAGLAIQDPRERPMEKAEAADAAHAQFADERSEFAGLAQAVELLRRCAQAQEVEPQAARSCVAKHFCRTCGCANGATCTANCTPRWRRLGWRFNETPATYEQMHRAVLSGLLGNIGTKTEEAGRLSRRARHQVRDLPRLATARRKGPPWLMAAELTETTRLVRPHGRCHRAAVARARGRASRARRPGTIRTGRRAAGRPMPSSG